LAIDDNCRRCILQPKLLSISVGVLLSTINPKKRKLTKVYLCLGTDKLALNLPEFGA
jgi:hypothetical protein